MYPDVGSTMFVFPCGPGFQSAACLPPTHTVRILIILITRLMMVVSVSVRESFQLCGRVTWHFIFIVIRFFEKIEGGTDFNFCDLCFTTVADMTPRFLLLQKTQHGHRKTPLLCPSPLQSFL